jgi:RNA polymerase sigma-70 factor (ECF subfamily)
VVDRAQIQQVMTLAADGERAAVDLLFGLLWPPVVGYATKFLGDATLAEDVAQDALVKLFGRLHQYDRERDALTWALTFTTWECRTARRRIHRRAETAEAVTTVIDGARIAEERELVHAALAMLESLPARDREVIAASLTDDDELKRSLAPATFRKRLERALLRLRTSWRSRHGTL